MEYCSPSIGKAKIQKINLHSLFVKEIFFFSFSQEHLSSREESIKVAMIDIKKGNNKVPLEPRTAASIQFVV